MISGKDTITNSVANHVFFHCSKTSLFTNWYCTITQPVANCVFQLSKTSSLFNSILVSQHTYLQSFLSYSFTHCAHFFSYYFTHYAHFFISFYSLCSHFLIPLLIVLTFSKSFTHCAYSFPFFYSLCSFFSYWFTHCAHLVISFHSLRSQFPIPLLPVHSPTFKKLYITITVQEPPCNWWLRVQYHNETAGVSGWISDSYCSIKPLWSGMGEVVPARTSPTLHPPSPPTVL